MNKLTKAQRHKYYKEALVELREAGMGKRGGQIILCAILNRVADLDCAWINTPDYFPEFEAKRPAHITSPFSAWWDEDDVKSRIAALKRCIAETKPKQTMETKKNKR